MFTGWQLWGTILIGFNVSTFIAFHIITQMGGKCAVSKTQYILTTIGLMCGIALMMFGGK